MGAPHALHYHVFNEAVNEYGELKCRGCDDFVDMSGAETVNDGIDIWNDHVREVHPKMV